MADLPSGTVTFLFTDIEGSTKRWQIDAVAMADAVDRRMPAVAGEPPRLTFDAHNTNSAGNLVFDTCKLRQAFPGLTFASLQEGAARLAAQMPRRAHLHQERT